MEEPEYEEMRLIMFCKWKIEDVDKVIEKEVEVSALPSIAKLVPQA